MSPVIMNDCGLLGSGKCHRTVVSSVLGKQFSNRRAKSLSTILFVTSAMSFSTDSDVNVRHSSIGRWNGIVKGPFISNVSDSGVNYPPRTARVSASHTHDTKDLPLTTQCERGTYQETCHCGFFSHCSRAASPPCVKVYAT
jgi:hypothetical protein